MTVLVILTALTACSDQTPDPGPTGEGVPATEEGGETTTTVPGRMESKALTTGPTATPARSPAPQATAAPTATPSNPASTPGTELAPEPIKPILVGFPKSIESEVPDPELACLAGAADAERLSRIFTVMEAPAPEEITHIMDCLQDETLLRMYLGVFVEHSGPMSQGTSECIRTSSKGIYYAR